MTSPVFTEFTFFHAPIRAIRTADSKVWFHLHDLSDVLGVDVARIGNDAEPEDRGWLDGHPVVGEKAFYNAVLLSDDPLAMKVTRNICEHIVRDEKLRATARALVSKALPGIQFDTTTTG